MQSMTELGSEWECMVLWASHIYFNLQKYLPVQHCHGWQGQGIAWMLESLYVLDKCPEVDKGHASNIHQVFCWHFLRSQEWIDHILLEESLGPAVSATLVLISIYLHNSLHWHIYCDFTSEGKSWPLALGYTDCRSRDWRARQGLPLARQETWGDSSERRWPHGQTRSLPPSAAWRTAQYKEGRHGQESDHSCPPASDKRGLWADFALPEDNND